MGKISAQINQLAKDVERAEERLAKMVRSTEAGTIKGLIEDVKDMREGAVEDLMEIRDDVDSLVSQLRYLAKVAGARADALTNNSREMDRLAVNYA